MFHTLIIICADYVASIRGREYVQGCASFIQRLGGRIRKRAYWSGSHCHEDSNSLCLADSDCDFDRGCNCNYYNYDCCWIVSWLTLGFIARFVAELCCIMECFTKRDFDVTEIQVKSPPLNAKTFTEVLNKCFQCACLSHDTFFFISCHPSQFTFTKTSYLSRRFTSIATPDTSNSSSSGAAPFPPRGRQQQL